MTRPTDRPAGRIPSVSPGQDAPPAGALQDRPATTDIRQAHLQHRARLNVAPGADAGRSARRAKQRVYAVAVLMDDGSVREFEHRADADLFLEDICAAFARGTLIATDRGEVAVEDLRPGDMIRTRDAGFQRLRWISRCPLVTDAAEIEDDTTFWPLRIKADALGEYRPSQDMIVSPRFRVLTNHPSCEALFGSPETLAPAIDLLDGESILRVRPSPDLPFFNLLLDDHHIITANGLETETWHPGNYGVAVMSPELRIQLHYLFPHLDGAFERLGRTVRPILKGFEATVLRVG